MMVTIGLLKSMDKQHAINTLRAEFDPLAGTRLEELLIDWVESLIDENAGNRPYIESANNHDISADEFQKLIDALIGDVSNTIELLGLLSEACLESPEDLQAELALAKKVRELATV